MDSLPQWIVDARKKWEYNGSKRPPFAHPINEGEESVWDYPRPPAVERENKVITVFLEEKQVIKSKNAFKIKETANPPTYYFPIKDVNLECFIELKEESWCEWKGKAKHWALKNNPNKLVAWSYPEPFMGYEEIKNYISIYPKYFTCYIGDEFIKPQESDIYGGWITSKIKGPFKGKIGSENW